MTTVTRTLMAVFLASVSVLSTVAQAAAATPPSAGLAAEMVAQLHAYGQSYVRAPIAELGDSKYIKVTNVSLASVDSTNLSVRFDVRLRVMQYGLVLYTVDGTAHGQFRLGNVTADLGCIAAGLGESSALTVTSLSIPHISTSAQYDGVKAVLRGFYPDNLCVPIRPTVTIADAFAEECKLVDYKPAPLPQSVRFTVQLSNLSARDVFITYSTANGSAIGGLDFTAVNGATLAIPSLSSTATISIGLRCDQLTEMSETFYVNFGNVSNATVGDGQAKGLILDFVDVQ